MSIYLSASSISDFIRCSQKVYYRRTKEVEEVKSKEMIIGIIAHKALEIGWDNRELAIETVKKECQFYGIKGQDRYNLEYFVDIYFLNFRGLVAEDDKIEYMFKFQMHDDIYMVGKMDRISNGNLIDWKTGKVPKYLGNDIQCIIYDYAYRKIFGKDATSICVASLSEGTITPYKSNLLYTNELFEKIIPRMIKTIKTESYERLGMYNHSCFRCPYKNGCLGGGYKDVLDSGISPE